MSVVRLKAALDAIKGSDVPNAIALEIAQGFVTRFKDQVPPGQDPGAWTNAQLADFCLVQLKRLIRRLVIQHKKDATLAAQAGGRAALDAAVNGADIDL